MSKLTPNKEVPANHSCPFLYKCNMIGPTCPTPAHPHKIDMNCSVARNWDQQEPKSLDEKIAILRTLTDNFFFIEQNYGFVPKPEPAYKIVNPYYSTENNPHVLVLSTVAQGFEKALDEAIRRLTKIKEVEGKRNENISRIN